MHVRAKVKADARKESIVRVDLGRYEISVKEKPENNAANRRVMQLLAQELSVPLKSIRFVSGRISPSKIFAVEGRKSE